MEAGRYVTDPVAVATYDTIVRADAATTYAAARGLDVGSSALIRLLLAARGIRTGGRAGIDDLLRLGFVMLDERPPEAFVLGLVGRFWTPAGGLRTIAAEKFADFDEPGFAKAAWDFVVTPDGHRCRLSTTTVVATTDAASARRFARYWTVVGPFSGLMRRRMLTLIRRQAESPSGVEPAGGPG